MNSLFALISLSLFLGLKAHGAQDLDTSVTELEQVEVSGVSNSILDSHSTGFSAETIEISELGNLTLSINQVLDGTAGINVRSAGGAGSDTEINLNGLSGKRVRFFLDEVPIDTLGTAVSLDDIALNLIERIEIYKGVVPIELGADALGGAINLVTTSPDYDFFDASVSYGSFDTKNTAIYGQKIFPSGYYARISTNWIDSENDYEMKKVPVTDDLGNVTYSTAKRFHDDYFARSLKARVGYSKAKWVDDFSIELVKGMHRDNIQHLPDSILQVFGGYYSEVDTTLTTARYEKSFGYLNIDGWIKSGKVESSYVDALARRYNWSGDYSELTEGLGELRDSQASHLVIDDELQSANLNFDYKYGVDTSVSINLVHSELERSGEDKLDLNRTIFQVPSVVEKTVLGLNLSQKSLFKINELNVFTKSYLYNARVNSEELIDGILQSTVTESKIDKIGYGATFLYRPTANLSLKTSYEKAYRLPESYEILGDGEFVLANPNLQPEQSNNVNLGVSIKGGNDHYSFKSSVNLFSRQVAEYIYDVPYYPIYRQYENLSAVDVSGIELSNSLSVNQNYFLHFNFTYQDLINRSEFISSGEINNQYGDRVPNEPYMFATLSNGYQWYVNGSDKWRLNWDVNFVESYFHKWESLGTKSQKAEIPQQITQDLSIEASFAHGTYHTSLSVTNVLNEEVYDRLDTQLPGRVWHLKLRYTY